MQKLKNEYRTGKIVILTNKLLLPTFILIIILKYLSKNKG